MSPRSTAAFVGAQGVTSVPAGAGAIREG